MNTITKEIILERLNCFRDRVDELGGTTSKIICKEVAREEEILDIEKELGNKLGYSIATISNWENLKSAPDMYNVEDVATYFNLPMDIFLGEG